MDSTFYRTPSVSTVTGWYEKTPPDFVFAAKVVNEFLPRLRFFLKRLQCVRYESWIRPDSYIEGHMEVVGAGY